MNSEDYLKELDRLTNIVAEQKKQMNAMDSQLKQYMETEILNDMKMTDVKQKIKAQEKINEFSIKELRQRDIALRNILEGFKNISSILEEENLLELILEGLVISLKAERGVMFTVDDQTILPTIYHNYDETAFEREYSVWIEDSVRQAVEERTTVYRLYEEIHISEQDIQISFACLPLEYEEKLIGIIYVDIVSDTLTFRVQDLDVAEIFATQAAISMNNADLYQRIKNQNLELLKLINIKDQLINEVTKKIRNPLEEVAKIVRKLDVVGCAKTEQDTIEAAKILPLLERMEITVDKFVTIQQLEKEVNDLFVDTVNFNELFAFILDYHKLEIERKNIRIEINLTTHFEKYRANRSILRTIFDELLSNAVFYNRENGTVEVNGFQNGDFLQIEIIDTGYGIKTEDIDKIFGQFYRTSDSPTLNDKGAGLGLYLVKKFIKFYNGDIHVTSVYGKGSKFTVQLMIN